jgi:hypothetical protein
MDSKLSKGKLALLILIILFSVAGIYLFIEAVRYSSSFSLLDGGPIDIDQSINSADVNGDLENGSSDVTIFFEDKDPFEKSCAENSENNGTSVNSNTVCIK